MKFEKERELLREFKRSIDDRFNHINKAVAQYINFHYDITAISINPAEGALEAKADHTLHGEYVFLDVEMDTELYLKRSFISDCSSFIYHNKGRIIEDIMNEYELFNEYVYKLYEEDILLDVYRLDEAFEDYIYSKFGKEYADMIKDELEGEYWIIEDKGKDKFFWKSEIKENTLEYAREELEIIKED